MVKFFGRGRRPLMVVVCSAFMLQGCVFVYEDAGASFDYGNHNLSGHPRKDRVFNFEPQIRLIAKRYQIDYHLLLALVQAESAGNPEAVSSANCRGLTQLSLATARDYDASVSYRDLHNPEVNLNIAGKHLARLRQLIVKKFPDANLEKRVLLNAAAWNAGWRRVREARGIPRIRETQGFVRRVLFLYRKYRWKGYSDMSYSD